MKKRSRQHGWMELRSYAPGDGGIAFTWVSENDPNGPTLEEPVTESDVSEWLAQSDKTWDGWDIVVFFKPGEDRRYWDVRLGQLVQRPYHTSTKLLMGDSVYEYVYHGSTLDESGNLSKDMDDVPGAKHHTSGNTDIYELVEGRKVKVENMGIRLGLCFFLNHEQDFERNGYSIRRKQ
jgi:hypothetical protein